MKNNDYIILHDNLKRVYKTLKIYSFSKWFNENSIILGIDFNFDSIKMNTYIAIFEVYIIVKWMKSDKIFIITRLSKNLLLLDSCTSRFELYMFVKKFP